MSVLCRTWSRKYAADLSTWTRQWFHPSVVGGLAGIPACHRTANQLSALLSAASFTKVPKTAALLDTVICRQSLLCALSGQADGEPTGVAIEAECVNGIPQETLSPLGC